MGNSSLEKAVEKLNFALIRNDIHVCEEDWNSAEDHVRDTALGCLGVDTIEDYVNPLRVDYMTDESWIEDMLWLWEDAMSVVRHLEWEEENG